MKFFTVAEALLCSIRCAMTTGISTGINRGLSSGSGGLEEQEETRLEEDLVKEQWNSIHVARELGVDCARVKSVDSHLGVFQSTCQSSGEQNIRQLWLRVGQKGIVGLLAVDVASLNCSMTVSETRHVDDATRLGSLSTKKGRKGTSRT